MNKNASRALHLVEAFSFSVYICWYIWQLQASLWWSWIVFPVWLIASFVLHKDTPKSLGWRADNMRTSTKRSVIVLLPCVLAVSLIGFILGGLHRSIYPLLVPRHFFGYLAFCLMQQVGLNSFVTNRLLSAIDSPTPASLLAGALFALLHWPNPVLVPLTFVGGFLMSWLFAKEGNILSLTVWHCILGTLVWWAFPFEWHHAMRVGPGFYNFRMH